MTTVTMVVSDGLLTCLCRQARAAGGARRALVPMPTKVRSLVPMSVRTRCTWVLDCLPGPAALRSHFFNPCCLF